MKAFELSHFGLDGLRLVDRPDPVPGPGQILLRMRAASLNYRDLSVVRGEYLSVKPPFIPISDGLGEVVALGAGVRRFKVGDRVLPTYITNWISGEPPADNMSRLGGPLDGVLAEYMAISEESAVRAPSHLSDAQAVTLPIAALTAWQTLFVHGALQLGQTVVVQGTGGVSLFALMMARAAGAEVIATSGNNEKLGRLKELGAHHVINYRETPDWDRRVLEITDRDGVRGAHHVLDIAGGETLKRSVAATRVGGTVYIVGYVDGMQTTLDLLPTVTRRIRLQAVSGGHRTSLENLVRAMELHRLQPVVDRVFPVTEVREALDYFGKGAHFGKVALSFEGFGK